MIGPDDLARERPLADARHVRLGDAEHLVDAVRPDPEAHRGAGGDRARGGHERVRPVIEIEQRALRALEEHPLTGAQRAIDEERRVRDVRCEPLREAELRRDDVLDVERLELVHPLQPDVLLLDGELELLAQDLRDRAGPGRECRSASPCPRTPARCRVASSRSGAGRAGVPARRRARCATASRDARCPRRRGDRASCARATRARRAPR